MELIVKQNVPLDSYTTLHVGGVADYFVVVQTKEDLRDACKQAAAVGLVPFMLGGGSNVLIDDGPLHRFVIKNEMKGISFDGDLVTAVAGEAWDALVAQTVERSLSGLENLSGIPGTVGAAPVQNINAYGASVADVIVSVEVYDRARDEFLVLSKEECQFGYRDSIFKQAAGQAWCVVAVTFKLDVVQASNLSYKSASQSIARYLHEQAITTPTAADTRAAVLHVRGNIGMLAGQFRSAGSFFKNTVVSQEEFQQIQTVVQREYQDINDRLMPWYWEQENGTVKIATAFLLECSPYNKTTYGAKRWQGVVGLSPKHSLSVVTEVGATAADVKAFVSEIIFAVQKIFSVTLQCEVDFVS